MPQNRTTISFLVPVYNEEILLKKNIPILLKYLKQNLSNNIIFEIIIGSNGSKDNSVKIAKDFSLKNKEINYFDFKQKGRGYAIKQALNTTQSDFLVYMDVDLATSLNAVIPLIQELNNNQIVIGSRYIKHSKVKRTFLRRSLSMVYNLLVKFLFGSLFSDLQCGFKGFNVKKVQPFVQQIKNNDFLFDTELLIIAKRNGLIIKEIPISWNESENSKVNISKEIIVHIIAICFLRWRLIRKK